MSALSHMALPTINFTIFVVTLIVLLKKPLRVFVSARKESFKLISDEALKKFHTAEERFTAICARHERRDKDSAELIHTMKSQGVREAESLIIAAKERARRMRDDVALHAAHELTKLKHELYRECVLNACRRAEQQLTATLDTPAAAAALTMRAEHALSRTLSAVSRAR